MPGYVQLYIPDFAEATKRFENQSDQGHMAEVMQRFEELLRQDNPFSESYKQNALMKLNICIKK
jgi:hypothetical protein